MLYDLKLADDAAHVAHTGLSNGRIFENLAALAGQVRAKGRPRALWIRTPLIPGVTATRENVRALGAWLAEHAAGAVERWELCAFNNLCRDQYKRMGLDWPYADAPLLSAAEVRALVEVATTAVSGAFPVLATGATRAEEPAP